MDHWEKGCMASWTTEKRDVSSAKSLVVDDSPQLRSLIYIKKNKAPKQIHEESQLKPLSKMKTDHLPFYLYAYEQL